MATLANLDLLINQLGNYQTRPRARAQIEALGPAAAERILPLISDQTLPENMRWVAITLIASWRYEPAIPQLLAMMREEDGLLKAEVSQALQAITGLECGESLDEWETALANPDEPAVAVSSPAAAVEADEVEATATGQEILQRALSDIATEMSWVDEDGGYLHLRIPLPGERKQQVVATFADLDAEGRPLVSIYTEFGTATEQDLENIEQHNRRIKYGKFLLEEGEEGTQRVTMRETVLLSELTDEMVREMVTSVAEEADSLELELTGADHI